MGLDAGWCAVGCGMVCGGMRDGVRWDAGWCGVGCGMVWGWGEKETHKMESVTLCSHM